MTKIVLMTLWLLHVVIWTTIWILHSNDDGSLSSFYRHFTIIIKITIIDRVMIYVKVPFNEITFTIVTVIHFNITFPLQNYWC